MIEHDTTWHGNQVVRIYTANLYDLNLQASSVVVPTGSLVTRDETGNDRTTYYMAW